jgi:nucleoid-associated protein YgaU
MRNDLKTGMLIGVALVIGTILIMSVLPGASIESRLRQSTTFQPDESTDETAIIDKAQIEGPSVGPDRRDKPGSPVKQPSEPATVEFDQIREAPIELPNVEPAQQLQIHILSRTQTLSAIALMYYGNTHEWKRIVDANPNMITDENRLRPGMRLVIPR